MCRSHFSRRATENRIVFNIAHPLYPITTQLMPLCHSDNDAEMVENNELSNGCVDKTAIYALTVVCVILNWCYSPFVWMRLCECVRNQILTVNGNEWVSSENRFSLTTAYCRLFLIFFIRFALLSICFVLCFLFFYWFRIEMIVTTDEGELDWMRRDFTKSNKSEFSSRFFLNVGTIASAIRKFLVSNSNVSQWTHRKNLLYFN